MKTTILTLLLVQGALAATAWDDEMQRANTLQGERRYAEAADAYRSAISKASQFGEADWRYAQAANNYAAHLFESGSYGPAAEQYSKAIRGFRAAGQRVNLGVATCNLAVLYRTTGRYADAIRTAREALTVLSAEYPTGSRYHISCETNLAEALSQGGHPLEAEAAARRAIETGERIAGPDDLRLSYPLHVLGNVLHGSGLSAEAIAPLQRALSIRKRELGPTHPLYGTTLGTYSSTLLRTGDLPGAETAAAESVRILEAAYGPDHVYLVGALNNLAQVRAASGLGDAEPLYRRALAISARRLGPKHPDHARVQANFAAWYLSIGRLQAAEKMYLDAAATLRAGVGKSHPVYLTVEEGLADVYARMGRLAEARSVRKGTRSWLPEPQIPAGFAADRTADESR